MRRLFVASLVWCYFLLPGFTMAETQDGGYESAEAFLKSLHYQKGLIDLPNGVASLNIPASFRYIGPEDAKRFHRNKLSGGSR